MDTLARRIASRFRLGSKAPEVLSASEVAKLPVGSIVWEWVKDSYAPEGRVSDSPLVVISDGKLTPMSQLPERSGSYEPDGDPASAFGKEFALVQNGKGQLPTKDTVKRLSTSWQRDHR